MNTWTKTHFDLDETDALTIANHAETTSTISLNLPGLSIHFTTAHLETVGKLLAELQELKALEQRANEQLQLEDEQEYI